MRNFLKCPLLITDPGSFLVVAASHLEYMQHVAGHRRLGQDATGVEIEIEETKYPNVA